MKPVTLQGPRVVLRPWRDEDLEPLFAINGDAESMRHFPAVMTRAESDAWGARIRAHFEAHGWGFWVVETRDEGAFAGVVGLLNIPWQARFTPAVEVGWRLHPGLRGRGLAQEAARVSMDFGFGALRLKEIVAFTLPGNIASRRVMERLGMRPDGRFGHPRLPADHPMHEHLLFRLAAPLCEAGHV